MANYVYSNELKPGDLIRYQVGGEVVQVAQVAEVNGLVYLANGQVVDGNYVELIGRLPQVRFEVNRTSGISHATINGKALCGARHTRNSRTATAATCEKCAAIMSK